MSDLYFRITDKAFIEEEIELGYEYALAGIVTVEKKEVKTDNEGGEDITYKARFTQHVELQREGKVIKAKDKKRMSQKLRFKILRIKDEIDPENKFEDELFYELVMKGIIANVDTIARRIIEKIV